MIGNTKVNLSATANTGFLKHLKVELKSQDIDNHAFELSFKDLVLDSTYTVIILSVFREVDREVKSMATISDGKAYFKFDTGLITGDDTVTNYVYVKHQGSTSDVTAFTFKVSLSEIDDGAREVAQYYDFHYETLLTAFKKEFKDYMDSLPENVIINDETIDLTKFAMKTDIPDVSEFVKWSDIPELEEDNDTIYDDTEVRGMIDKKQDKLIAGSNIIINPDNTISAIDTVPNLNPYALKTDLPDLRLYATKAEIPDTSKFITKDDIPKAEEYDDTLIKNEIASKQDKLVAGDNITIGVDNVVTAKDTIQDLTPYALKSEIPDTSGFITAQDLPEDKDTIYTAGENITIDENNVISSTASGGGGKEELQWIPVTYGSGYEAANTLEKNKLMYSKSSDGLVRFKGASISVNQERPSSEVISTTLFILPEGYRPFYNLTIPIRVDNYPNSGVYHVVIGRNGYVKLDKLHNNTSNEYGKVYHVNHIVFQAEDIGGN